jgi:L-iditol 2-dehydrogenase
LMKALMLSANKQLEIVEMEKPSPREDEILVRIQACGICGSDVHGFDGSTGRRIPPIVMGHEAAGVIEAVGTAVDGFRPGNRVTFDSTVYCGRCFYCTRGQINLCDHREVIGVSTRAFRRMGAFAEYVTVPARIAYHLPDELSFSHAAMIEAVSVAVHVIVLDVDDSRLALARSLGATRTLNSRATDVIQRILELTSGRGADVALECVGISDTVRLAMGGVRKGGAVTLVGNVAPTIELGLQSVVTRQIRLQGSCASNGEYPTSISMMARDVIKVGPLISAVAPLEEGGSWFDRLYEREPGLLKVVLEP